MMGVLCERRLGERFQHKSEDDEKKKVSFKAWGKNWERESEEVERFARYSISTLTDINRLKETGKVSSR